MNDESHSRHSSFIVHLSSLLADHRIILIGGKGGVGKTTIASAAALHVAQTRPAILFTTDPASNLGDIFAGPLPNLTIEELDAQQLYAKFLERNLSAFLELGDRGTYLEKDELKRFFELSLPGVDELMAWMHIGELAEENPGAAIVVDTAPTGHTLRMLGGGDHFRQLAAALDAMQEKHREMVRQFTRRDTRDAMDAFVEQFTAEATRRRALLTSSVFVPVFLAEPWVVEQTRRLIAEVREDGLEVPLAVLNRFNRRMADVGVPVATAERVCVPLDTVERIRGWTAGTLPAAAAASRGEGGRLEAAARTAGRMPAVRGLNFFAGKGGVGKTTLSCSVALQLAKREKHVTLLSVDPAHSVKDVFANQAPPANLAVETIDTKAMWQAFRASLGEEIERAVSAFTPSGMSVAYDAEAMRKLVEIAPPGADELFAIRRLADLIAEGETIVVDTAPTGHFLRLIDLPKTAGEWVREFIRILLRYKELVPPGSLGEELVRASRALASVDEALHSDRCAVFVVTRPERIVVAETKRLTAELERRGIRVGGIVANYVTPEGDDRCDRSMRAFEDEALASLGREVVIVERREGPVVKLEELKSLLTVA